MKFICLICAETVMALTPLKVHSARLSPEKAEAECLANFSERLVSVCFRKQKEK
jgi:hypothetical protein